MVDVYFKIPSYGMSSWEYLMTCSQESIDYSLLRVGRKRVDVLFRFVPVGLVGTEGDFS